MQPAEIMPRNKGVRNIHGLFSGKKALTAIIIRTKMLATQKKQT